MYKRFLSLLLVLLLFASLLPAAAFAEDTAHEPLAVEETVDEAAEEPTPDSTPDTPAQTGPDAAGTPDEAVPASADTDIPLDEETAPASEAHEIITIKVINEGYRGILTEDDIPDVLSDDDFAALIAETGSTEPFTSIAEAGAYVRSQLKLHATPISFSILQDEKFDRTNKLYEVMDSAYQHTGNPIEGDYLQYSLTGGYGAKGSAYQYETGYRADYTLTPLYYTPAQQEAETTAAAASVLSGLALQGKSDYEKIEAIYNWLKVNVTYDYDVDSSIANEIYTPFTAYGALVLHTCVCQGYASAFYRLCLQSGVDARIVTYYDEITESGHAWNIAAYQQSYYQLDPTWDSNRYEQGWGDNLYFMRGTTSFQTSHSMPDEYADTNFAAAYPLAADDAVWQKPQVDISTCTAVLEYTSAAFTGSALQPKVTLSYPDGAAVSSSEYTVEYSNNINPGVAGVKLSAVPDGELTGEAEYTFVIIPPAAEISSLTNISTGVKLTWGKVEGATGYKIYRSRGTGGFSLAKTITDGGAVSWTDTGATSAGTKYNYKIVSIAVLDGTTYSSDYSAIKTICRLTAPEIASVENTSAGIKVTWTMATNATGYKIYRSKGTGGYTLRKTITSGGTLSFTDTSSMTNGTRYRYKIVATGTADGVEYNSAYSAVKTIYRLTRPAISSATSTTAGKITVKWGKNDKATGYQIKYVKGTTEKTVTVTSKATVSKVLSSLTKGATYKISIRSYKTVNGTKYYSAWSAAKSVTVKK